MSDSEKLYLLMDESSAPLENADFLYPRTKEDEEFDKMIVEKYHLITKDMEDDTDDDGEEKLYLCMEETSEV